MCVWCEKCLLGATKMNKFQIFDERQVLLNETKNIHFQSSHMKTAFSVVFLCAWKCLLEFLYFSLATLIATCTCVLRTLLKSTCNFMYACILMCTHAIVNGISKKKSTKSAHSFQLRIDSLNRKRDNDNAETPINSFRWFGFFLLL